MVAVRPERPAVGLPLEPSGTDPAWPEVGGLLGTARELRARTLAVVEQRIREVRVGAVVIPQRHKHVTSVAANDNVLRFWKVADAVRGKMALNETPVCLRIERLDHGLDRTREP